MTFEHTPVLLREAGHRQDMDGGLRHPQHDRLEPGVRMEQGDGVRIGHGAEVEDRPAAGLRALCGKVRSPEGGGAAVDSKAGDRLDWRCLGDERPGRADKR